MIYDMDENAKNISGCIIRPADKEDLKDIYVLERKYTEIPWSEKSLFDDIFNNPNAHYYVAVSNNSIAGYIGFWLVENSGEIINLAVSKEYRRKGIGKCLVKHVCKYVSIMGGDEIYLEVSNLNKAGLSLYESEGFNRISERKNYYSKTHSNAIIMLKKI